MHIYNASSSASSVVESFILYRPQCARSVLMLSQDSLDSSHLAQWTVVTRLQIGIYKTLTWLCLARKSKITKSFSFFMGSDQRSNDQGGGLSPDILVSSWSRVITEGLRWSPLHMWCCHWPSPSETDTERDHSDSGLRWAPSHRDQGESMTTTSTTTVG